MHLQTIQCNFAPFFTRFLMKYIFLNHVRITVARKSAHPMKFSSIMLNFQPHKLQISFGIGEVFLPRCHELD